MSILVDTSVWSLALRRNGSSASDETIALARSLANGEAVFTTGLILQELLQGFSGPKDRALILNRFSALPVLVPDRADHVDAAMLRNQCRRSGVQIGTIDALLAELCIRHDLTMLTTDGDFKSIAAHYPLKLWKP